MMAIMKKKMDNRSRPKMKASIRINTTTRTRPTMLMMMVISISSMMMSMAVIVLTHDVAVQALTTLRRTATLQNPRVRRVVTKGDDDCREGKQRRGGGDRGNNGYYLDTTSRTVLGSTISDSSISSIAQAPPSFHKEEDAFTVLSKQTFQTLQQQQQQEKLQELTPTSPSLQSLQQTMENMRTKSPTQYTTGQKRNEASTWWRWMNNCPSPLLIDLTSALHEAILTSAEEEEDDEMRISQDWLVRRVTCRLVLLPSGESLSAPLVETAGSIVLGTVLLGGVTRYHCPMGEDGKESRWNTIPSKREGEETVRSKDVNGNDSGSGGTTWMQQGGSERWYEALDAGLAAILELTFLPPDTPFDSLDQDDQNGEENDVYSYSNSQETDMELARLLWDPTHIFDFHTNDDDQAYEPNASAMTMEMATPSDLSGNERNEAFASEFQSAVGGLKPQIDAIVRRVLDGRILRPADPDNDSVYDNHQNQSNNNNQQTTTLEATELALLNLTPVRGLLLHGPPGCGKTALAREISKSLRAREPRIVSAPELLDRWVGGSEKLIRDLFRDAEAELAACGGDATKSALHVLVIDEIDAVFRKRSLAEDGGEVTRSSAVNQILAKLDGVKANSCANVLLIGMTNRRELLDEALLRPGRLEVQIEIPLPDREGRREILGIHFHALRMRKRLSYELCCAIDGIVPGDERDGDVDVHSTKSFRTKIIRRLRMVRRRPFDLAADSVTGGFSGADIAGLVRCAGSIALARARKDGAGSIDSLSITLEDVKDALIEVRK